MDKKELPVYDNFKDYIETEKINFSEFAIEAYKWYRNNRVEADLNHFEKYHDSEFMPNTIYYGHYDIKAVSTKVEDYSKSIVMYLKHKIYNHEMLFKTIKDKKLEDTFYKAMYEDVEQYVKNYLDKNGK